MAAGSVKAFIVDDEYQSRNLLSKLLMEHVPEITITGQASNVQEGIAGIKEFNPALVFLDIEMNGETGFDFLRKIDKRDFQVIFITAHNDYALKAFRFNAIDYLLKPIVVEELKEAVDKAINQISGKKITSDAQIENLVQTIRDPKKIIDKIAVPTSDGFVLVSLNEIVYCRANGNYTEFHLTGKRQLLSSYTLKQYHELLEEQNFFRAHRSYLINLSFVKMYRRGEGGTIVMNDDSEIELSRQNKDAFLQLFR
ncbi:MAG: LytTR family DNA-binding domain-containing protein [Chitinophagaceae bacterium]